MNIEITIGGKRVLLIELSTEIDEGSLANAVKYAGSLMRTYSEMLAGVGMTGTANNAMIVDALGDRVEAINMMEGGR